MPLSSGNCRDIQMYFTSSAALRRKTSDVKRRRPSGCIRGQQLAPKIKIAGEFSASAVDSPGAVAVMVNGRDGRRLQHKLNELNGTGTTGVEDVSYSLGSLVQYYVLESRGKYGTFETPEHVSFRRTSCYMFLEKYCLKCHTS